MEIEGMIHQLMEPTSGVSKNGNPWMSQEFILAYFWFPNQTTPSYALMRVFGEDRIKLFNLQQGEEVKLKYVIEAREHDGKWYNEVRVMSCEKKNQSMGVASTSVQATK